MKKAYLIVEGQKEVVDKVREILVKLKHFSSHPYTLLAFELCEFPEWMLGERRDLADTLETLRAVAHNC